MKQHFSHWKINTQFVPLTFVLTSFSLLGTASMFSSPYCPKLPYLQPFPCCVFTITFLILFLFHCFGWGLHFTQLDLSSPQFLLPQAACSFVFRLKKNTCSRKIFFIKKTTSRKSAVAPQVTFTWEYISSKIKTNFVHQCQEHFINFYGEVAI